VPVLQRQAEKIELVIRVVLSDFFWSINSEMGRGFQPRFTGKSCRLKSQHERYFMMRGYFIMSATSQHERLKT